ncbi:MAG: hypothetical protein JWQ16_2692 [Novosphingobium sp.]|nr:hypothetical protein [Novosphingobium sp.]
MHWTHCLITSQARVLTIFLALWSLAITLTAFCSTFTQLIAARFALGRPNLVPLAPSTR